MSEASARGVSPSWSPKEMLQNKIVLFRVLARVPPGKAPEQDCYYQEMPSRGSGHGVPQERHQKKIVLTRKYVPEDLAEDYAQEKFQNKIVIAWKYLPEALPGLSLIHI